MVLFALALCLCPITTSAQEARGKITGSVTDPNKAAVAGASVKITNLARGTTVTLTTNDQGIFQAPYLLSGTYQVVVENAGFKKYVQTDVTLQIDETRDLSITLEVGGTQETVTVTAEAPPIDDSSANMGQVVDAKRVADLPLVHGDPYTLIGLSPGVNFGRDPKLDRPFEPTHIVGFTIDGTRANRSDLTIDGVPSTATANANEVTASYVPPTDIIQEFKVQTATFDSQFGNTEGGVTSIGIKSGTNSFHGTAYLWKEPGSLAANDAFGQAAGTARPESFSDRWGGSASGPVILPKLYHGKNKTFFLFGYEHISDSRPRNNGTPTVPTAAMKNGDFSQLLALGTQYQIYNPFSRRVEGSRFRVDPFKCDASGNPITPQPNGTQIGGTNCNKIPASLINPVAKNLLKYFPDPLQTGAADGTNDFQQASLPEIASYYNATVRIDHNFSDKHRFFARASWYQRDSTYNNYFHNLSTGTLFQFISRQGALDDVYTFNPTTVLNVRYGYNRFIRVDGYNPDNLGFDLTSVGFPGSYNSSIPENFRRFPRLDITGYQGTGFNNEPRPIDSHAITATLNKTINSHSLKFGAELRMYRERSLITINDTTGRFIFDATYTRGPLDNSTVAPGSLGQSFAAFLLGIPSPSSYVRRPADYAEESRTWGFFVQDDWRFNSRLTLNIGLRYEFETPLVERFNKSVRAFDPNYIQPIEPAVRAKYALNPTPEIPASAFNVRGALTFPGQNGEPRGLYETPKNNFMPRIGVAYRLNDKTVIRAGYGMFYGFLGQRRGDVIQSGFSRDTNLVPTVDGVTFVGTLSNPFPNGILEPLGSSQGPQTFLGQAITVFNTHPLTPYNQRWELGVQRELMKGWVGEVAYVGNRGTHIEINRNINATPQKYLSRSPVRDATTIAYLSANLPNPFFGILPASTTIGASSNITRERLLRPFPEFDTVNTTTNDGYSWYHALQTRLERRFSKGYTLQFAYTYSKFMQATELLNQDDPRPSEVISDSDYPHRFSASGVYELPLGAGKHFMSDAKGLTQRVVGGWQVQAVMTAQSGAPIAWGNIIYNGNVSDIRLPASQQNVLHWFNTNGFVTASAQQLASNVRTFPLRFGWVRYPKQNNWDISVMKNTLITEGMRIQFRFEMTNAFNRVWLANPNGTNGLQTGVTSATFGQITGSTQANYPRRIQLGLKFIF